MAVTLDKNLITIPREAARKAGGFVILPIKEYEKLREQSVPTYYLSGKEAKELDKLVREGEKEYREGKCESIKSLSDLD